MLYFRISLSILPHFNLDTLGLEILSGQIRVLHLCVKQWKNKSTEKHYRNENRREQILSLAEECGHGFRNINNFFQNN